MKSTILSRIGVQAEASFGGSASGDIYSLEGWTELEQHFEPLARSTRINVWRQEQSQALAGKSYRGRLDIELKVTNALNLLVQTMLALRATTAVEAGTRYEYRMRRADTAARESVRLVGYYEDGPWFTFSGVVLTGIRLTIRARQVVRMSLDWVAASKTETDVDPEWVFGSSGGGALFGEGGGIFGEGGGAIYFGTAELPEVSSAMVVEIDDSPITTLAELSVELESPLELRNLTRLGVAGRFVRNGPGTIGGSLREYFIGEDLPTKVRAQTEFALDCVANRLTLTLPLVVGQSGQPTVMGDADVVANVSFKALSDDTDEPVLMLTVA